MAGRTLVIGDIHGCFLTLEKLVKDKIILQKEDQLYLLGDYVDRGPRCKEVIDYIMHLIASGYQVFPLLGNHEFQMLNSVISNVEFLAWQLNGGQKTLDSFGIKTIDMLDIKYMHFFRNLEYYYLTDDYVLVHGGINFEAEKPMEDKEKMLWIRNEHVDRRVLEGRRLIVGHTPLPLDIIISTLRTDKIMLDGGCVYSNRRADLGYLVAFQLENMKLFSQKNIDY
jgi:serine/threonine protein phosphatase 1